MANYYDEIDKTLKKQIEEALVSIDAQEKAALARLEQRRAQAQSSYYAGTAGAYSDYAHAVNPFGVNNENLYSAGLGNSGKSETAKASYYNAYTSLLGNLKDTYSNEITELNLEEQELGANTQALRTQANSNAYNKLLDELVRRQEAETEAERFEYQKEINERDYNFKVAQAEYQKQMDERDYQYKLQKDEYERYMDSLALQSKGYSSGGSSSGGSGGSAIEPSELEQAAWGMSGFEGTGMLTDAQFNRLKDMFLMLTYSALPEEDNPTPRIRRYKTRYLDMFKSRLTPSQIFELSRI